MKSLWGLFTALVGLFIVWLWATGRADKVWKDLLSVSSSQSASATQNLDTAITNLSGAQISVAPSTIIPITGINPNVSSIQFTPTVGQAFTIPQYVSVN